MERNRNRILLLAGTLVVVIMSLLYSRNVWSASAGSRQDAVNWVYAQEGKSLDYDHAYGAQCVDLIKYYYAYFGYASYAMGNASAYVSNALPEGWTRIQKTSGFIPEPGDIAVWGADLNSSGTGHVAIVLSANENSFVSMDQNWPQGSACKQVTHTYNKFWGVIRPNFDSVVNQAPLGNIDSFGTGNGCINLSGWAYDPDNTGEVVELRIEVGSSIYTVKANQTVDGYNDGLAGHAVATSINVSERGSQNVKVWAIDTNADNNTLIKEETLIINSDTVPIGHVDAIGGGEGIVGISGWASDADTPGENITLRLDIVDGNSYIFTTEGIGTSGYPSYSVNIPVKEFGTHEIRIYVLDQGPYKSDAKDVLIKTETITIGQRHLVSYIDTHTEKIEETVGDIIGLDGTLKIEGWIQDINGIDRVEYEILDTSQSTGGVKGVCEHRKRDDVAAENPGYPTGNEGFYAYIPYKDLRYAFYYPENMKITLTAYCNGGEAHFLGAIEINRNFPEKKEPVISDIQITDISYKGYTIKATVSDESGIDRVQFPTWTLKNDQDDLFEDWGRNEKASAKIEGNTVTYRVNTSDHNNEYGIYKTHIYAYDKYGNYVSVPINDNKGEIEVPERNSYIISYDANGGVGTPKDQKKLEEEDIILSDEIPLRRGYKFIGWQGKNKEYQPGDVYTEDRNEILIAMWEEEEHSYIKTIIKEATCTEDGIVEYKCSLCGKTYTEIIPAKGHTKVIEEAVAATCETEGKTEGAHCSVCGKVLQKQEIIPAKGHTEVIDEAIAATCEAAGKTEGKHCSACGKVLQKQEIILAKGHMEVIDEGIEATCETEGRTEGSHCSVCNKVLQEQKVIPAKGHTEVIDKAVVATCETDGKTEGSHCSVCNKVLQKQEVIPAKGHTAVIDEAVAATCETDGKTEGSHCSVCGKVLKEQKIIPATGHSFDNVEIKRPATQYTEGLKVYTCSNCGATRTEVIAKLPSTEQETPNEPELGDPEKNESEQPGAGQTKREEVKNTEKQVPVGSVLVEEKTGGVYKVLRVHGAAGEVQYMKPTGTSSTVVIPDTVLISGVLYRVTEISDNAFKGNINLRKVVIGKYVKRIGKNAFANCKRLQNVTMGSSVTVIDDKAFFKCTSLKKITIPGQIAKIGKKAFFGAKKLKTVTIKTKKLTMKNVGSKAFKGIYAKAKIKVPKAKKKVYIKLLKRRGVSGKVIIKG